MPREEDYDSHQDYVDDVISNFEDARDEVEDMINQSGPDSGPSDEEFQGAVDNYNDAAREMDELPSDDRPYMD